MKLKPGLWTPSLAEVAPNWRWAWRGLRGAWLFSEGTGANIGDVTPSRNHGSVVGSHSWVLTATGPTLNLDDEAHVTVPNHPALNVVGSQITVEFRTVLGPDNPFFRLLMDKASNNDAAYRLMFNDDDDIRFRLSELSSPNLDTAPQTLTQGREIHIFATYDGAEMRIYVDGEQVASQASSGSISGTPDPLTFSFDQFNNNDEFVGSLVKVALYDRALTAKEILQLYRDPFGPFRPAGTLILSTVVEEEIDTGPFVSDTFTDDDDTLLTNHMPEIGGAWEKLDAWIIGTGSAGPLEIFNNAITRDSGGSTTATSTDYRNEAAPTSPDYYVQADHFLFHSITSRHQDYLLARMSPTGTSNAGVDLYYAGRRGVTVEIGKRVGGTVTVLATDSHPFTHGNTYTYRFEVQGNTLTLYVDDVEVLSTTDSDITEAGRVGVASGQPTGGNSFDNFEAGLLEAAEEPDHVQVSHSTDTLLASGAVTNDLSHSSDLILRATEILDHDSDLLAVARNELPHLSDLLVSEEGEWSDPVVVTTPITHGTDILLIDQAVETRTHETDLILRATVALEHTTDLTLRATFDLSHDTSLLLKATTQVAHGTDLRTLFGTGLAHSTDVALQGTVATEHSADLVIAQRQEVLHSTDAVLRVSASILHESDLVLRATRSILHSSDVILQATPDASHETDLLISQAQGVGHVTDLIVLATATEEHSTDLLLVAVETPAHLTDVLVADRIEVVHSTNVFIGVIPALHTTDVIVASPDSAVLVMETFSREQAMTVASRRSNTTVSSED